MRHRSLFNDLECVCQLAHQNACFCALSRLIGGMLNLSVSTSGIMSCGLSMLIGGMQDLSVGTKNLLIGCKMPLSLPYASSSGDVDETRRSLLVRAQAFPFVPQSLSLLEALRTARSEGDLHISRPVTRKHQREQQQQMSKSVTFATQLRQVCS